MWEDEEGDVTGGEIEYDLAEVISQHIEPGTKAVLLEVGNEKLRYINAYRQTITSDGVECENIGTSWDEVVK